jgi:hypothetical protein
VVLAVTVERPPRPPEIDLPVRPLGRFDRTGSKWCPVWRPQRDNNQNSSGIPAEFVIALDRSRSPVKRRGRNIGSGGGKRFKDGTP